MQKFIITEKAGRFVANHGNTGVGTVLELPAEVAAAEVELGALVPAPEEAKAESTSEPDAEGGYPAEDDEAGKPKRKR